MNSKEKLDFLQGEFLQREGLVLLNQYLLEHNQNFRFGLVRTSSFKINQQTIGIVITGTGSISGNFDAEFETNDILLLSAGEYRIKSADFKILLIAGENLFDSPSIIKQTNFPILPSTLGGTRKLLKTDGGKFNIDVHLIWVNEKNIKIPHYHAKIFELYLVEAGVGEILLKNPKQGEYSEKPKLSPGRFVLVPPGTVHKAQGADLIIAVVGIPAFYENDSVIIE